MGQVGGALPPAGTFPTCCWSLACGPECRHQLIWTTAGGTPPGTCQRLTSGALPRAHRPPPPGPPSSPTETRAQRRPCAPPASTPSGAFVRASSHVCLVACTTPQRITPPAPTAPRPHRPAQPVSRHGVKLVDGLPVDGRLRCWACDTPVLSCPARLECVPCLEIFRARANVLGHDGAWFGTTTHAAQRGADPGRAPCSVSVH